MGERWRWGSSSSSSSSPSTSAKAQAGIGLETDTFFTLYFLLTGFHLLHVLLGIVILAAVALSDSVENLKTGTAFWHMVDLVWVVMYPLVYLIG